MSKFFHWILLVTLGAGAAFAQFGDPFDVDAELDGAVVRLSVNIPAEHYLYADALKVTDAKGNLQEGYTKSKGHL